MKSRKSIFTGLILMSFLLQFSNVKASEKTLIYNQDGSKKMHLVRLDDQNFKVVKYHSNGIVQEQGHYRNGLKNGCWLAYDEKGNCISRVYFDMGDRTGVWDIKTYDKKYTYQIAYEDDRAILMQKIDDSGDIVETREP